MGCSVYFIQSDHRKGAIKIGVSKDVQKRLDELQIGNPCKLNIIATIDAGTDENAYYIESCLHNRLRRWRIRGEWFKAIITASIAMQENIKWIDNEAYAMAVIPGRFNNENGLKGRKRAKRKLMRRRELELEQLKSLE